MKVKTFTGNDPAVVDEQVNFWLAKNRNVMVLQTSTAFKALRERGKDAITGKTERRRGVGVAISIWYEERPHRTLRSTPDIWIFGRGNGGTAYRQEQQEHVKTESRGAIAFIRRLRLTRREFTR